MKKLIIILGVFLVCCLMCQNIFGQTPEQIELAKKWEKYGLFQPAVTLDFGGYKITKSKVLGLAFVGLGGVTNGLLQGYEFDGRTSFERKWGADRYGYWGSLSWAQRYKNHDPAQGLAKDIYRVAPVFDFYHTAQILHHHSLVTGGIVIGIGGAKINKKWWHYGADILLSAAVNSCGQRIGLWWVRN